MRLWNIRVGMSYSVSRQLKILEELQNSRFAVISKKRNPGDKYLRYFLVHGSSTLVIREILPDIVAACFYNNEMNLISCPL